MHCERRIFCKLPPFTKKRTKENQAMIRQFFRQAWTMMKQHKLFTGMYIAGTAISIAMAMAVIITLYIKLGPLYPEYNRGRMLSFVWIQEFHKSDDYSEFGAATQQLVDAIRKEAKQIDKMCIRLRSTHDKQLITNVKNNTDTAEELEYVNSEYWRFFDFRFIHGRGFNESDEYEPVAVITSTLADKLFARHDVCGEYVSIGSTPHKIVGVVEPSTTDRVEGYTSGNIWAPAYYMDKLQNSDKEIIGNKQMFMLAKSAHEVDALKNEIKDIFNKYIQQFSGYDDSEFHLSLIKHWENAFQLYETFGKEGNLFDGIAKYLYAILAFLFIPALNLCGMISTRMNSRLDEIGVRRAYGATTRQIISQVLYENLLLTFAGAIVGLLLSYLLVAGGYNWILTLLDTGIHQQPTSRLTMEMLLNPTIVAIVLLVTVVLNIASALVPTVLALRTNIIESLYNRR